MIDNIGKIKVALGLLNSMVECKESHSDISRQVFKDAFIAIKEIEQESLKKVE